MTANLNREAAYNYVKQGFSVIACQEKSKHPAVTEWRTYQERKPTRDELDKWFPGDKGNLAIITGEVSDLVVLDVDNPSALAEYDIPETLTARTGKGYHYYFKHPGCEVSNGPIPGLGDVKADGGYVIAPPSLHPEGKRYEWINPEAPLAECPVWIIRKQVAARIAEKHNASLSEPLSTSKYGLPWFKDVKALAECEKGNRNDLLNRLSFRAGQLTASGDLSRSDAELALRDACKANGLWQEEQRQCDTTIASGFSSGERHPATKCNAIEVVPVVEGKRIRFRPASSISFSDVDWLWDDVLAKGSLTIIAGDPGCGKSLVSHSLSGIISSGGKFPVTGQKAPTAGRVAYISLEEDPESVMGPRLEAAGCDMDRVYYVSHTDLGGDFRLPRDMDVLADALTDLGEIDLLVLDPVSALSVGLDSNSSGDVRSIVNPLIQLAAERNVCILLIMHTNKSSENRPDIDRVSGSKQFVAGARVAYRLMIDPDNPDRRLMVNIKNNLGARSRFAYQVELKDVLGVTKPVAVAVWENDYAREAGGGVFSKNIDGFPSEHPF